jgi:hypothetical protein
MGAGSLELLTRDTHRRNCMTRGVSRLGKNTKATVEPRRAERHFAIRATGASAMLERVITMRFCGDPDRRPPGAGVAQHASEVSSASRGRTSGGRSKPCASCQSSDLLGETAIGPTLSYRKLPTERRHHSLSLGREFGMCFITAEQTPRFSELPLPGLGSKASLSVGPSCAHSP